MAVLDIPGFKLGRVKQTARTDVKGSGDGDSVMVELEGVFQSLCGAISETK